MCWAPSIWHKAQNTQLSGWNQRKSRACCVLWRESNPSIRFQMGAIWLITSEKRIKLWFYIRLSTWISIFKKDKFISLRAALITHNFHTQVLCLWIMAWKVHSEKLQNIPKLIIAGVLQKPYISDISGIFFSFYCSGQPALSFICRKGFTMLEPSQTTDGLNQQFFSWKS